MSERGKNERGAVLLTTLLVMTIMATIAVAMIDDVRFAVKRAVNVQSFAQADWYVLAAEDFALSYLSENVAQAPAAQVNTALQEGAPVIFPIEGGTISLMVRDGSQCFSLGTLKNANGQIQFRNLLEVLGWDKQSANRITWAAVDWIDPNTQREPEGAEDYTYLGLDPAYRAANAPFLSAMDLRALAGVEEADYQALRPFLCARDAAESGKLNVNTLSLPQAPLLAAFLGGQDYYPLAQQIIRQRPSVGYPDLATLTSSAAMQGPDKEGVLLAELAFRPEHIWIEADIYFLEARRTAIMEFVIEGESVRRTFRRFNAEARRPFLKAEPS